MYVLIQPPSFPFFFRGKQQQHIITAPKKKKLKEYDFQWNKVVHLFWIGTLKRGIHSNELED